MEERKKRIFKLFAQLKGARGWEKTAVFATLRRFD
jgi:hypothetical protein